MKVLFLIYSHGPATGGHFHSLDTISRHIGKVLDVGIISIGSNASPVLATNIHFREHVQYSKDVGYLSFSKKLKKVLETHRPDIVHFFDAAALCLSIPVIALGKYKVVLNKCGGPNPIKGRWVYCPEIIFFSLENYEWFKGADYYKKCSLSLIPNRVEEILVDKSLQVAPVKDTTKFNIVRITRISPDYWHTMQLAVRLAAFLGKQRPVKLYVIGRVYDNKINEALLKYAAEQAVDLEVITDARANKAVNFLYLADAVVGTGRSVMEAMSFGLPVMAPSENTDLPVLVNKDNFDLFFRLNFSQRVSVLQEMKEGNNQNLLNLVADNSYLASSGEFSKAMFNRYFNVSNAVEKYREVYNRTSTANNLQLLLNNISYLVREIINGGKR